MSGGLLLVTAHPDDEVLIAGLTLAASAAAGLPTGVLCLTHGELGPIADDVPVARAELGVTRKRELEAACAELGVEWVECLGHPDGNLTWSDPDAVISDIKRRLELRGPDTVITFGEDGLYYHPDHIATFEYTRRAIAELDSPPALYRAVCPQELMPELVSELRARGLPTDLWELEPEDFGAELPDTTLRVEARPFVERKLRALRCHRTQLHREHAFSVLPMDLAERFLGVEHFAAVGLVAASDRG